MKKQAKSSPATSRPIAKTASVKLVSPPAATPSEAQRLAAIILEVLAGVRRPTEAAQALSVSLPRYYQLEARALEGLVAALAPRPRGKQASLEGRVKQLEKQLEAARRQCAREEALVRVTQRALGLASASRTKPPAPQADRRGRKQRRPMVRALRAARVLEARAAESAAPAEDGQTTFASVQPTAPSCGAEEVRPCSA